MDIPASWAPPDIESYRECHARCIGLVVGVTLAGTLVMVGSLYVIVAFVASRMLDKPFCDALSWALCWRRTCVPLF